MKIGYEDSFDYDYPQNKLIYEANSFTYYLYDFEIEVIDLAVI